MIINLRNYYPNYYEDVFVDVSNEIASQFQEWERRDRSSRRKMFRYSAQFSLDRDDGIEGSAIYTSIMPDEVYEEKQLREQLHIALTSLPEIQARRIRAHYYLGLSMSDIARAEGVERECVSESIDRGLRKIKVFFRNFE